LTRQGTRLHAGLEQQDAAAEAVDAEDGDEGGQHVDGADDDGAQQRGGLAAAQGAEQDGAVEDDLDSVTQRIFSSPYSCVDRHSNRLSAGATQPSDAMMAPQLIIGAMNSLDMQAIVGAEEQFCTRAAAGAYLKQARAAVRA